MPTERPTALMCGWRPLKRWRYVAVIADDLIVAAADVRVGPLPQRFFAIAARGEPVVGATRLRGISLAGSRVRIAARGVEVDIELEERGGRATVHRGPVWTRKQAGIAARGSVRLPGRPPRRMEARAVVDDTAGYHARHTRWLWSAGVGELVGGEAVAWNLVSGVNDEPEGSERAIWVGDEPFEPAPLSFAGDLSGVSFADGSALRFDAWGTWSARTNLGLVRSSYRLPFGSFAGELPGGRRLATGRGVMERHDARW